MYYGCAWFYNVLCKSVVESNTINVTGVLVSNTFVKGVPDSTATDMTSINLVHDYHTFDATGVPNSNTFEVLGVPDSNVFDVTGYLDSNTLYVTGVPVSKSFVIGELVLNLLVFFFLYYRWDASD